MAQSHIDSPADESSPLGYLLIPDMLAGWPWQRKINPLYEEVAAEANAWLRSFSPFNAKSQQAFERCDFSLLAALTFPEAPREQLRTSIDLINLFFLIDEYTDTEPTPTVRGIIDVCIDALHNPRDPRPDGEVILGEIVRQAWERGQRTGAHQNGKPFVASFTLWLCSVVTEAEIRHSGAVLTAEAYRAIRLDNVGVRCLCALEGLFSSIPDRLYDNHIFTRMTRLGCELVYIDNDILSYNREQATGIEDFNIVTITMHQDGLSLDDAIDSLVKRNADLEAQFLGCYREFCSFLEGPGVADEPSEIRRHLDHMGNVRRSSWCWSFEGGRYFGKRGSTYAKTQMIPLIPKKMRDKNIRGDQIDVMLMEEELEKL